MPRDKRKTVDSVRRDLRRSVKKNPKRMTGEAAHKQDIAVILKIANYTNTQIANALGESKSTIKNWFAIPEVEALYQTRMEALGDAAVSLMQTYTIEAIQELVAVMRRNKGTDDTVTLAAIKEILDRGGVPKASRTESKSNKTVHVTTQQSDRPMSPEEAKLRSDAAKLIEEAEKATADAVS